MSQPTNRSSAASDRPSDPDAVTNDAATNLPLVIGVTGHRNFASDDPQLSAIVAHELKALKTQYLDQSFVILSALAEGADRLVARVGQNILAAPLLVPLPLPVGGEGGYEIDFPNTQAEFFELLAKASHQIEPPLLSQAPEWHGYTEARNDQYAWVGAYLAEHSDILIAIWDGAPARGTGGTQHVVTWFKSGKVPKTRSSITHPPSKGADILPVVPARKFVHINPKTGEVHREDLP